MVDSRYLPRRRRVRAHGLAAISGVARSRRWRFAPPVIFRPSRTYITPIRLGKVSELTIIVPLAPRPKPTPHRTETKKSEAD